MYKLLLPLIALAFSFTAHAQDSFMVIDFPTGQTLKRNSEFSNINCFVKFEDEFYTADSVVITYSYLNSDLAGRVYSQDMFDNGVYERGASYYGRSILTPNEIGSFKLVVYCKTHNSGQVEKILTDTVETIIGNDWNRDLSVSIDPYASDSIIQGDAKVIFYIRNMGTNNFSGRFSYSINTWTSDRPNEFISSSSDYAGGTIYPGDSMPIGVLLPEWVFESTIGHKTETCFSIRPIKNGTTIDDHLANNIACLNLYNLGTGNVLKNRHTLKLSYSNQSLRFMEELTLTSRILVYGMNGQLITERKVEPGQNTIAISKPLPKGMYQVVLSNENGHSSTKLMVF